jgi:hypothetical protein
MTINGYSERIALKAWVRLAVLVLATGALMLLLLAQGQVASASGPAIIGHSGNFSTIATFDYATGTTTAQFATGASDDRGRGVEVVSGVPCSWNTTAAAVVYYASITGDIHVAPYAGGFGGPEIVVPPPPLPNPRTDGNGIQDLDYRNGVLYAMTGYNAGIGAAPIVYGLNPCTGAVLSSRSLNLNSPSLNNSDGFTVLPSGDFLINDGDGQPRYRGYSPITGNATGLVFTVSGANGGCTGVDYNSSDISLYFFCNFSGTRTLARTDLSGNPISTKPSDWAGAFIEDISVLPPAVGGVATLTVSNPGSSLPWTPLAAVAASVMAVLAVGLWYGRRRWLR